MMRTILWMNPATMVRIILLRWRTLWNLLQMSNEKNLTTEFRTLWTLNIIDLAIERVRTFYKRGDLYAELLSKNYLTGVVYRVDEIIESLGLERSVYYNRRQEAVLLFGYALWAIVIPREKVNARTESGG